MNNANQQLLFARVGFSTRVLAMLNEYSDDKKVSERTLRTWASGERTPKNPFYKLLAEKLDNHLSQRAMQILVTHNSDKLILNKYSNDDDFWSVTHDFPLPHEIHTALIQRICIFNTLSENPVDIELVPFLNDEQIASDEYDTSYLQDWDSYVNLSIDIDLDVSVFGEFAKLEYSGDTIH